MFCERIIPFEAVQVRNDRDISQTSTRQKQMENLRQLRIQNQSMPSSVWNEWMFQKGNGVNNDIEAVNTP